MSQTPLNTFIDGLTGAFREGDAGADAKAAEARNVERLQSLYRALSRGDFAGAAEALTEDVTFEISGPPSFEFVRRARGRKAALDAMVENFSKVEDQKPEVLSLVAQGNAIVVIARERGRLLATGTEYDLHWTQLFEFRDGLVARFREYSDHVPSTGNA